jgi:hypothetical protein
MRRLRRDTRAVSALEFALILPILVMFSAGLVEFGRLILLTQKLQNGAFILADLAARDKTLSEGQVDDLFLALGDLVEPFDIAAEGRAIVTGVMGDVNDDPLIMWQREGAGSLDADSSLGDEGEFADLPDELSISEGETIIVAEVFYAFEPLFGLNTSARTLRKVSYFKPRLGTLDALLP